jgi:hypothetical protein
MSAFDWLDRSNPVSLWWIFLASISTINICFWFWTRHYFAVKNSGRKARSLAIRSVLWLAGVYVFVCAFRSYLPRADVQRICLFDTWFSSVFVGRSVATVAELCFVTQWAIVLNHVAKLNHSRVVERISYLLVPLIVMAECFSWYAVVSTNYMGNTFEESLWSITYTLVAISLIFLFPKTKGTLKYAVGFSILGSIAYILFMTRVDVPMYFGRWQSDLASGTKFLSFLDGIRDLNTRWIVTYKISDWKDEIPWMSLYFSGGVWTSLGLCYVNLE